MLTKLVLSGVRGYAASQFFPFGLCNAPSTLQHLVDMALASLTREVCLAYLDDLIIFSSTFKQHLERLQTDQMCTLLEKSEVLWIMR